MIPSTWIPAWMDQLGWVLVHFLWQGVVIGIVCWVLLMLLRKSSAQIRYVWLCISLLTCALSPCLTWAVLDNRTQPHVDLVPSPGSDLAEPTIMAAPLEKTAPVSLHASLPMAA